MRMRIFALGFAIYVSADILPQFMDDIDYSRKSIPRPVRDLTEYKNVGLFGKCASTAILPSNSSLSCDPPNKLPQICTLVCKQGYYSSGAHKDVACADSLCVGPTCIPTPYTQITNEIRYGSRECLYTRWVECDSSEEGLCLETVSEPCQYSYYVAVETKGCFLKPMDLPNDCWTSGCFGNCDRPGPYHYYSTRCSDKCAPWQDPAMPDFVCSPCRVPFLPNNAKIVESNGLTLYDVPSQITIGCADGYWGTNITTHCMSTDGSFYPPVVLACSSCSEPPIIEYETFEAIRTKGLVEFRCVKGYVGDSAFTQCDRNTGVWNLPNAPNCYVDVSPSPSMTPSVTNTAGFSVSSTKSPSVTRTPSISKSPRPQKVKGSRAPSPAPKWI